VDHVILGFIPDQTKLVKPQGDVAPDWPRRQQLTLEYAAEFFRRHRRTKATFTPMGVAQGWSPSSYEYAVKELQRIGYRYIALGGMVPLKTPQITDCLAAIATVRKPKTRFHLLGVTRTEFVGDFARFGVTSFDSTSPFRQAFKDDRDNYYTTEGAY